MDPSIDVAVAVWCINGIGSDIFVFIIFFFLLYNLVSGRPLTLQEHQVYQKKHPFQFLFKISIIPSRTIESLIYRRAAAVMLRSGRLAAAANEDFNQTPPPSYLVLMEEGLPSYEEAVMVGQEMRLGIVSDEGEDEGEHCYLPSYVEAYRVDEEGTEVAKSKEGTDEASDEVFEEALEEVKLEEVGTEMAVLEVAFGENLNVVKVVEVGTEMTILEGAFGEALDEILQEEEGAESTAVDEVTVA